MATTFNQRSRRVGNGQGILVGRRSGPMKISWASTSAIKFLVLMKKTTTSQSPKPTPTTAATTNETTAASTPQELGPPLATPFDVQRECSEIREFLMERLRRWPVNQAGRLRHTLINFASTHADNRKKFLKPEPKHPELITDATKKMKARKKKLQALALEIGMRMPKKDILRYN
jgi:hypothetical protein